MREIAPAITPLAVGFLFLLGLILVLGIWSEKVMSDVSFRNVTLIVQHGARLRLLLDMRLALTKLDNEARARSEIETRRGFRRRLRCV